MSRKPSPLRDFIEDTVDTFDFMMTSERASVRALKYVFFASVAWFALSVAAMLCA